MESSSESDKPRRSVLHSISSDEPKFQLRTSLSVSEGHTSGSTEPQIRNSHLQIIRTMSNAMQSDKSAENSGDSSIRYIRTTSQQGSFSGKPGEQQNQVGKVKLKSIDKQKRGASEQWQGKSTVQGILSNGPRQGEQLQVGIDDAAVNENSMERKSRARQPKKSILSSSTRRTSLTQHHDRHGTNSQGRTSGEEYLSARFASTPHLQQGRQWRPSASPEGDEDDEPDFLLMAVVEHERQQEEYSSDDSALDSGDEEAPNATGTNWAILMVPGHPPVGQFTVAQLPAFKPQPVQPPARAVLGIANPQPTKLRSGHLIFRAPKQLGDKNYSDFFQNSCPKNWVTGPRFGGLGIGDTKDCPGWQLDWPALDGWQFGEKAENTAEKSKKRTTRLLSRRELAAVRYSLACLTMFFLYPGCSIFLCSLQTPAGIANQASDTDSPGYLIPF
ncbi:unnamed protein product [Notodromas monacha]|uniref:Uncharacterized protein n=1 Tax=Notodromas monacha TaxID=399045 RepID=A0A7R9GIX1_9CRUS|nr:unnamed protein product [Notodromas monacha]CAG0922910.1 unnamed protein product [Notodromas monacha]